MNVSGNEDFAMAALEGDEKIYSEMETTIARLKTERDRLREDRDDLLRLLEGTHLHDTAMGMIRQRAMRLMDAERREKIAARALTETDTPTGDKT